ncbi:uncharacterized protein LOC103869784 [Brassica rapa]|uniref:uncharacterized protein LOC103869784 n=1 Tax=Brassica campestris TaxID=3711 RepID=UPI00142E4395|nr:uncharacterized protein LOC103869784 [Brassica rapa]
MVEIKDEEAFYCTCVYANNQVEDRRGLWEDLIHHHSSPTFKNNAWMIMGDFNEILEGNESSRFVDTGRVPSGMRDFQSVVLQCHLVDMTYQGPQYTWFNKREVGVICKKLDRVLLNEEAVLRFQNAYSVFEPGGCSDHMRCNIQLLPKSEVIKRPFKYVNSMSSISSFLPMVKDYWDSTVGLFHSTSAMYRFSKKLKNLKPLIRELAREKLGNLTKRTKDAYGLLCEKIKATLACPSETTIKEETFHRAIRSRQAQNLIREIRCPDGNVVNTHEEVKKEAERFFKEFLNKCPSNYQGTTVEELRDLHTFRCTPEDCGLLEAEVTDEEVLRVLFAMPNNKSPGPDGFPAEFFKTTWPVLSKDFIVSKLDSLEMKDFRPIACCNVLYKVVSKILANRLKQVLPRIIQENQSAFVQGRLLMENVLLTSELVKDYHKDTVSPRCVMKIDISKAFNSVQWSFVLESLQALGFPVNFIHWIKLCITSPSFSVQINGDLAGYFQSSRGLRQGCSLSPYLFVLCMNVLSLKLDRAMAERRFKVHPGCKKLSLTHLCFADDLMVFVEGSKDSIQGAFSVFEEFEVWSGLSISVEKSTIYMAGITTEEKSNILTNFKFAEGELPVRYLGLPLMTQAMRTQDYSPLLEHVRNKINTWTCRYLSYAGRLQLISSVIISIVNFWIAVFRIPCSCIREVEKICSAFLWTCPVLKSSNAKVAWKEVSCLKCEGGLGIRDLREVNKVYGLKLIWRLLSGDSLWGKWIHANLLKGKSFWVVKSNPQVGSWMWRKMLKLREVAKLFYKKELGNGRHTSFWYDHWSEKGVLHDLLGDRGVIDLGIGKDESVEDALLSSRRRRKHRVSILNDLEEEMRNTRSMLDPEGKDVSIWKGKSAYKQKFSTQETWKQVRVGNPFCVWASGVWFSHATPKFAFMAWLASRDRLSTMDRVVKWSHGVDTTCVLCNAAQESRDHLFFECQYTARVWEFIVKGILGSSYTNQWSEIMVLITDSSRERKSLFCLRYSFQAVLYGVWRERNKVRHGDRMMHVPILQRLIEKSIRNKISVLRKKGIKGMEMMMQYWFLNRM